MAFLKQLCNGNTVSMYELGESVSLGRLPENEITVDDPTVSARHAKLERLDGQYVLTDLDSTNGLLVKGKPIAQLVLEQGMSFSIGTHDFEFYENLPPNLDKTLRIKKSWIPGVYYTE